MRIARLDTEHGARFAEFDAAVGWRVLNGTLGGDLHRTGAIEPFDTRLLAPCEPTVVIAMAHNGLPGGRELPQQAFLKSARTVVGPHEKIVIDPSLGETQVETELAIVIGRHCRNLTTDNALGAVFGYTIANDVTAVDQIPLDELLTQAKNGDGFTPIGPWIETDLAAADDLELRVFVDDVLSSTGSTSQLAALVRDQLVYVTRHLALGPGDIILGGCPGSFAAVKPGQRVRLEIDGLGALENTIHAIAIESSLPTTLTEKAERHAADR